MTAYVREAAAATRWKMTEENNAFGFCWSKSESTLRRGTKWAGVVGDEQWWGIAPLRHQVRGEALALHKPPRLAFLPCLHSRWVRENAWNGWLLYNLPNAFCMQCKTEKMVDQFPTRRKTVLKTLWSCIFIIACVTSWVRSAYMFIGNILIFSSTCSTFQKTCFSFTICCILTVSLFLNIIEIYELHYSFILELQSSIRHFLYLFLTCLLNRRWLMLSHIHTVHIPVLARV